MVSSGLLRRENLKSYILCRYLTYQLMITSEGESINVYKSMRHEAYVCSVLRGYTFAVHLHGDVGLERSLAYCSEH
jgi:hypothetical protein